MSIFDASLESSCFCLQNKDGKHLKENHQYFYQVQAQLYVTHLPWCDFVVWSPNEIYVERVLYNQGFIEKAIAKARAFYFDIFLPPIVSNMLICTGNSCPVDFTKVNEETDMSIPTERPPSIDNHNY